VHKRQECVFDDDVDHRRRPFIAKKLDANQLQKTVLDGLLNAIKSDSDAGLRRLIQSGASLAEVATEIAKSSNTGRDIASDSVTKHSRPDSTCDSLTSSRPQSVSDVTDGNTIDDRTPPPRAQGCAHARRPASYRAWSWHNASRKTLELCNFGNLPLSSAIKANNYPHGVQVHQLARMRSQAYTVLPIHDNDRSPVNSVILEFREAQRRRLAFGVPLDDVLGPLEINGKLQHMSFSDL